MKTRERLDSLTRSPRLAWDILYGGRYDFTYDQMPVRVRNMSRAKRLNLIRSGLLFLHRSLRPGNWPLHMQFELTSYCNLRCPVCPTGLGELKRPAKAMDPELFAGIMTEVGPTLLTTSLWGWGESLLHPEFAEFLRIIGQYPIASLVSTNGQNLNDERVIDALLTYPPVYLIVALDGLTDETNSIFRVGAKLAPALGGVRRLAEAKRKSGAELPVLHMRFMVMNHNQHELDRVQAFARENEFELLTIRTLSIIDSDERRHQELVPDDAEYRAYDYQEGERIHLRDFVCMQPFWFPSVYADGTVVACEQDFNAQQPLGIVSDHTSFGDIWFGPDAPGVRRTIRDNPESLSFCRNCPYTDRPDSSECSIQAFFLTKDRGVELS